MMMQRIGDVHGSLDKLYQSFNTLKSLQRELYTPMLANYVFSSLVNTLLSLNDAAAAERLCVEASGEVMMKKSATPMLLLGTLRIFANDLDGALGLLAKALEVRTRCHNHAATRSSPTQAQARVHSRARLARHMHTCLYTVKCALVSLPVRAWPLRCDFAC